MIAAAAAEGPVVSKLLNENQNITELDINPIIVLQKGATAVDARIVLE